MYNTLSFNPIFRGLSSETIEKLFASYHYQLKSYHPKDIVVQQGEACNYLMIILKGCVQGQMIDYSGKLIVIEDMQAPKAIATAFLFCDKNEMPVTVVATEESQIVFIRREIFTEILQANSTVLHNYLKVISNRSKFLSDKINFLTFRSLKSKIADLLYKRSTETQSTHIQLNETQQELADLFGVARPSLARTLKEMEDDGLISYKGKKIDLLLPDKIKQMAQ